MEHNRKIDEDAPRIPTTTATKTPITSTLNSRTCKAQLAALTTLAILYIFYYQILYTTFLSQIPTAHHDFPSTSQTTVSWSSIPATSDHITWHLCYKFYNCTRISLPLDHLNISNPSRITIALIRLPSNASSINTTHPYLGPVFFNPGGPGGSGIYAMLNRGHLLQSIIGANHDLISFDPRGVGLSEPVIDCWDSVWARRMWELRGEEVGDANNGSVFNAYARAVGYSRKCAAASGMLRGIEANLTAEKHPLLSYVSTASVARDFSEILRLFGEKKLKYWGFSYGTYIGGVFASMFPEKVERMVLDGNVNFRDWQSNTHMTFARDADKIIGKFYEYCAKSVTSALHVDGQDAKQVEARVDNILEGLKRRPIVTDAEFRVDGVPEIVTYSLLQRVMASSMYQPLKMFPRLARILKGLERGDAEALVDYYSTESKPLSEYPCGRGRNTSNNDEYDVSSHAVPFSNAPSMFDLPSDEHGIEEATWDASTAVLCTDGDPINDTLESAVEDMDAMMKISKTTGAVNAVIWLNCYGWKIKAKDRFIGSFGGNTSHPILFVSNEFDNVTPVGNSKINAEGFDGAGTVMLKGGFGHTSLSTPSKELSDMIYNYFQTGELPKTDANADDESP